MKNVRKIPVLAILLLAITQPASAQLRLGIMGGVNSSNFRVDVDQPIAVPLPDGGSDQGSFDYRTSYAIGGVAEYYFTPTVGLSVQPMYSRQGGSFVFDDLVVNPLSVNTTTELSYFDIPVMLKVQVGRSAVRPYLTSGFTFGFLTSAKSVADSDRRDIKSSIKNTNSSWIIGGGFNLPAGGNAVFIEGRYSLGLTDINEGPQVQPLSAGTALKTKGFQFVLGLTFPVGAR